MEFDSCREIQFPLTVYMLLFVIASVWFSVSSLPILSLPTLWFHPSVPGKFDDNGIPWYCGQSLTPGAVLLSSVSPFRKPLCVPGEILESSLMFSCPFLSYQMCPGPFIC